MTGFYTKAPTLRGQGQYNVSPGEVAFDKPPLVEKKPNGRIRAIKELRDEFPDLSLWDAREIVDGRMPRPDEPVPPDHLELTDAETRAAKAAMRRVHANPDVKLQEVIAAINYVRSNDPVGTLRRSGEGQYAFSYEPGKWLLIDVDKPAYRAVESPTDSANIRRSWQLLHRPS